MRILYHHRTLGDGAEGIHVHEIVRALRGLGHDVRIVALIGDQTSGHRTHRRAWSSVRQYIPAWSYEIAEIAYNVIGSNLVARAVDDFKPDFIYDRYNSYSSAATATAVRMKLPLILEINAPVVYERMNYENLPLRFSRLALRYERRIFAEATHLIAVSTPLKQFIMANHGIEPEKISVLPNGVDPIRFAPQEEFASTRRELGLPEAMIIGFVGTARPWHGLELLVHAFAPISEKYPDVHLLLLGGGPSSGGIKRVVGALGLDRKVTFVDRVGYDCVPRYVSAMDIAVSPRATFYASPLKLVEYMAMAKAIVAPAMVNIEDLLRHEETALLFEPENVSSLASMLERLIGSAELREKLGRAARIEVEQRRHWTANARRILHIYGTIARPCKVAASQVEK